MTAKRAKPVRAWAVYSRTGLVIPTVRKTRNEAIEEMWVETGLVWHDLSESGYRIARVTVTEDRK